MNDSNSEGTKKATRLEVIEDNVIILRPRGRFSSFGKDS